MAYFQNPFNAEYRGHWTLGDSFTYSLTFICPANSGRSNEQVAAFGEPSSPTPNSPVVYDLSGLDADGDVTSILKIRMCVDGTNQNWINMEYDLTDNSNANLNPAPVNSAIEPWQIVSILNADANFSTFFTAALQSNPTSNANTKITIRQKFDIIRMKFFILNGGAESILRFNARAGVSQMPNYFERSKVWGGDMSYPSDGVFGLVYLDPSNLGGSSDIDNLIIDNAVDYKGNSLGFNSNTIIADYEHLRGRASGLFKFKKNIVDVEGRITETIEYSAGSQVGDLCRKINYSYVGSNTEPSQVTEIPYILESGDLVTP